jgi:anti-anti-sigma factor
VSTATRTALLHHRPETPAIDESHPDETRQCGRAVFEVHHLSPQRLRVSVAGEVDATNREALGHFIGFCTRGSQQLIVDLSRVDFFGSQGFTALHYVSVQCARGEVDWVIVDNRVVQRILRICDSAGDLPVVGDLGTALDKLDRCSKYRHSTSPSRMIVRVAKAAAWN